MIDQDRQQNGRYYLLGSVNPVLVKHISESFAGRVGIVELTPFLFSEISNLDIMEGHFLVRRLPPYFRNIKKRIVKSPKIYIRDSGILHYLLGISGERSLLESPKRGSSWEGFMIEQIIGREMLQRAGSLFYFYRTHAGAEIDLIIDRGRERLGRV